MMRLNVGLVIFGLSAVSFAHPPADARPAPRASVVIPAPSKPIPFRPSANVVGANSGVLATARPVSNTSRIASVPRPVTPPAPVLRTTDIPR